MALHLSSHRSRRSQSILQPFKVCCMDLYVFGPCLSFSSVFQAEILKISYSYPMLWQGANSGGHSLCFSSLHLAVCRSHDLIWERVWTITFFSHFCTTFRSRDLVCVFMKSDSSRARHEVVTPTDLRPACQCMR